MMTKQNKSAAVLFLIFAISFTGSAQVFDKYAGEFLSGGTGSRYLALGNNSVSFVDDAFSVYWNPAGLASTSYPQFVVMHNERFSGLISYDFIAMSYPLSQKSTVGLGVLRNSIDNIPYTVGGWNEIKNQKETNFTPTYFNAAEYAFFGSIASTEYFQLPIGISTKVLWRQYGNVATAWGVGFDAGIQLKNVSDINDLSFGLTIHDFTSTYMSWSTGHTELISPSIESGISYSFDFLFGRTLLAFGLINRFENRQSSAQYHWGSISHDLKTGAEYSYNDKIGVRLGYNELKRLNAGVGLKVRAIWIDYAFEQFDGTESLGNSHRLSISFTLDKERFLRPQ